MHRLLHIEGLVSYDRFRSDVWALLCAADQEFVPSLSSRNTTCERRLATETGAGEPRHYFDELMKQDFVLMVNNDNEQLMGFSSFKHGYTCPELAKYGPSNYVTTTIVRPELRGRGIARGLYRFIEHNLPEKKWHPFITRRTWSTNLPQLSLFKELQYEEVYRIKDDRGHGIDTVYFAKSAN